MGTDFAHRVIRCFIDRSNILRFSHFTLFVDLVKAFDRVPRELVLGWPRDAHGEGSDYLAGVGFSVGTARYIA
eukprot:11203953-Lingulodinium_polyedra.AAC.1